MILIDYLLSERPGKSIPERIARNILAGSFTSGVQQQDAADAISAFLGRSVETGDAAPKRTNEVLAYVNKGGGGRPSGGIISLPVSVLEMRHSALVSGKRRGRKYITSTTSPKTERISGRSSLSPSQTWQKGSHLTRMKNTGLRLRSTARLAR